MEFSHMDKKMKYVKVGGMSEAQYGIETLKTIASEEIGNYTVLFVGPWSNRQLRDVVEFCVQNGISLVMDEMWGRLTGDICESYRDTNMKEMRAILRNAKSLFEGSLFMCEYGGLGLYWPETTVRGSKLVIPRTGSMAEAKKYFVMTLKKQIKKAVSKGLLRPLVCIEASAVSKYLMEAGIDRVDLEVTYDRFNELYFSAVKGAALCYGKKTYGVDMAMVHYGGNEHGNLWRHRWKTSLYHAFIRGADPIYAEHGLMDYRALGKNLNKGAPEVKAFRRVLADFYSFARCHPRPYGFPEARIAVIQGNLDGFAMGEKFIWGQRHPGGMRAGSAEKSWELFESFYRKIPWQFPFQSGDSDFSGNPPLGQVDIIPAESPLSLMSKYGCLIFLGWNTMTPEIYSNLKKYVRGGGHLLATLAHLNASDERHGSRHIINRGDMRDLFGVTVDAEKISFMDRGIKFLHRPVKGRYRFPLWTAICDPKYDCGRLPVGIMKIDTAKVLAGGSDRHRDTEEAILKFPFLVSNVCGKGMSFLVNTTEFPGHDNLKDFYSDMLYFFSEAFQKELLVETCESMRFAAYREKGLYVLYLLNTAPDCLCEALITYGASVRIPVRVRPGSIKVVYLNEQAAVIPHDPKLRITDIAVENRGLVLKCLPFQGSLKVKSYLHGKNYRGEDRLKSL